MVAQANNTSSNDNGYRYEYTDDSGDFAVRSSRSYSSQEDAEEDKAISQELFDTKASTSTTSGSRS